MRDAHDSTKIKDEARLLDRVLFKGAFMDNDFIQDLINGANKNPTYPSYYYDEDNDALEMFFKNGSYHGKNLTDSIVGYYSYDDDELIGMMIMGVKAKMQARKD